MGRAAGKAKGINLQALGHAAQEDAGFPNLVTARVAGVVATRAKAQANLTEVLQDSDHGKAQAWARKFDTKYQTVGRVSGLYEASEFGIMVRDACYGKKIVTVRVLADTLQLGKSRGDQDRIVLFSKLKATGIWSRGNIGTSY